MHRLQQALICALLLIACFPCAAQDAVTLRHQGLTYAQQGDYVSAGSYLAQAAELGYYTAQVEYAILLDTSPAPVNDNVKAYAWYSVVIARHGSDTTIAEERRDIVAKRMDAPTTQTAEQLAGELVAKFGVPIE